MKLVEVYHEGKKKLLEKKNTLRNYENGLDTGKYLITF